MAGCKALALFCSRIDKPSFGRCLGFLEISAVDVLCVAVGRGVCWWGLDTFLCGGGGCFNMRRVWTARARLICCCCGKNGERWFLSRVDAEECLPLLGVGFSGRRCHSPKRRRYCMNTWRIGRRESLLASFWSREQGAGIVITASAACISA